MTPLKRLACVVFLSLLPSAVLAREGFGFLKKTVDMQQTRPPAVRDAAENVRVVASGARSKEDADAQNFRDRLERAIQNGGGSTAATAPNTTVTVRLERLTVTERWDKKTVEETREVRKKVLVSGDKYEWKTVKEKVKVEKRTRVLTADLKGTYQVADARNVILDSGTLGERLEKKYPEGTAVPSSTSLEDELMHAAVRKVAARVVPTSEVVKAIVPKGSFETLIPLAEAGAWERYLAAIEAAPQKANPGEESYRQYALGLANEALAYRTDDRVAATARLRAAVEHYTRSIALNPREDIFQERFSGMFSEADAPLSRARTSLAAYERWSADGSAVTAAAPSYGELPERSSPRVAHAPPAATPTVPTAAAGQGRIVMYRGKRVREDEIPSATTPTSITPDAASLPVRDAPPAMTNETVIAMSRSGLSDESIILAIDAAKRVQFDASPNGLMELSKAGVTSGVIIHIQKKSSRS